MDSARSSQLAYGLSQNCEELKFLPPHSYRNWPISAGRSTHTERVEFYALRYTWSLKMDVCSKSVIKGAAVFSVISIGVLFTSLFNIDNKASAALYAQRSGATIYAQNCARCHGNDGRAQTAKGRSVGATNLTSAEWMPDTARDIRIVTRGKEEMPSFKGKLKPAEIEAVVSYIRRFKQ